MSVHLSRELAGHLGELRHEPTRKHVRARAGSRTLVDSRRAVLVWEPKRVVPSYAVPVEDVNAVLEPAENVRAEEHPVRLEAGGPPVLDPRTPFAAHTCDGVSLSVCAGQVRLDGAAFRPSDPDLADHVILDFSAFDEWFEEDEVIVGHPRDPFSRIDVRHTSTPVRVELDGVVLAESTGALLLFETHILPRFYLPRADVRTELLTPTDTITTCAYKGHARYWAAHVHGQRYLDLVWSYERPLSDARDVAWRMCFLDERVDVIVDGVLRERPVTPWS
ncbi:uncharacterized protein (DUF427 family) [Herbihabitans rhizosphaerae]|uniref:Uncharacterized protein (DUF427 family) n=1 Tax=Herbihabitans rhizosphaerae TaxID=1872711 RepID=A0A4Q7KMF0_9PSEU|nr:DUF427 domain-containing protein [Herbihabitans rhizosphaerae]RZS37090.1 uncharacterized protein (DUF427 family) [Herbihabitans rhizosphaerae]